MPSKPVSGRYSAEGCGLWTEEEHKRFLSALEIYPNGPWKKVSELVGTRNSRQTMTHAQKYRQKLARHERGLRPRKKTESDDNEATSPTSKPQSRVAPRRERRADSKTTTKKAEPSAHHTKVDPQALHYQQVPSYQHPPWSTTASPVDVSLGDPYQMKPVPSSGVYLGNPGIYISDQVYTGQMQRSHDLAYPKPLDPHIAFNTYPPSHSVSIQPLDPLPLVSSVEDPRWIDECYDLFVGAVV